MAHLPSGTGTQRTRIQPGHDIYTALVGIGLAIVMGSIAFVVYRCVELFDSPLPGFISN
jgi:hypothetical protein